MEDNQWAEAAEAWERAYRKLKAEYQALDTRLTAIVAAVAAIEYGCGYGGIGCRCSACQALVDLRELTK